jgi:hypothetical protein
MIEDTKRAMFLAKANFLVAQALFNYIETMGSFIEPYGKSGERFDAFLSRMGDEYTELLKTHNKTKIRQTGTRRPLKCVPHVLYDDLRCGLTHEYFIKRKKFIIYNPDEKSVPNESEIDVHPIPIDSEFKTVTAGIMYSKEGRKEVWRVINLKLWLDFRKAVSEYINDIKDRKNRDLRKNFFERARNINMIEFLSG